MTNKKPEEKVESLKERIKNIAKPVLTGMDSSEQARTAAKAYFRLEEDTERSLEILVGLGATPQMYADMLGRPKKTEKDPTKKTRLISAVYGFIRNTIAGFIGEKLCEMDEKELQGTHAVYEKDSQGKNRCSETTIKNTVYRAYGEGLLRGYEMLLGGQQEISSCPNPSVLKTEEALNHGLSEMSKGNFNDAKILFDSVCYDRSPKSEKHKETAVRYLSLLGLIENKVKAELEMLSKENDP